MAAIGSTISLTVRDLASSVSCASGPDRDRFPGTAQQCHSRGTSLRPLPLRETTTMATPYQGNVTNVGAPGATEGPVVRTIGISDLSCAVPAERVGRPGPGRIQVSDGPCGLRIRRRAEQCDVGRENE